MAGQTRRSTRRQGRSSYGDSSWPVLATASAVASGSATDTLAAQPSTEARTGLPTRTTYRSLLLKGMAPEEAANLTAYLAGIPIGDSTWTLKQINQLLFLRQMQRTGRFGPGTEAPAH
jgi:hypothetical protein